MNTVKPPYSASDTSRFFKLPKWAQEHVLELREELRQKDLEIERLKQAHAILTERRGWFTIQGPPDNSVSGGLYKLFYLGSDGAHPACTLGVGDLLLVGRKNDAP